MSAAAIKVLIAKPGLDGHDVGVKVVVHALIDAGFEVIYTGLRQTPEAIVERAVAEGVDVIGLSILSGAHMPLCRRIKDLMRQHGIDNKTWIVGGNVPAADREALKDLGVAKVFPTGSRLDDITSYIRECAA